MSSPRDTILALSSAPPGGASEIAHLNRAILRLSGTRAIDFASSVFKPNVEKDALANIRSWKRVAGTVMWSSGNREHTLPSAAYIMRSPRSYTREDIVELHLPGLRWLVSQLIDTLLDAGARMAQPGEFTRRAYENGRISLAQAQSVSALIQATTADEARAFAARLQQRAPKQQQKLRTEIEALLSQVELGLDFATEDVEVISLSEMQRRLESLRELARGIAQSGSSEQQRRSETAEIHVRLPRIVLAGPTNAGKSSLFNALLNRDAALVSATRHTTRDRVEAPMTLRDNAGNVITAVLIDTAGAGEEHAVARKEAAEAQDWLRHAAWQMSLSALRGADVLLLSVDASEAFSEHDWRPLQQALAQSQPATAFVIWTKSDLPRHSSSRRPEVPFAVAAEHGVSAHRGSGISELHSLLHSAVREISDRTLQAAAAAEASARVSAQRAAEALDRAAEALAQQHGEDVVAVELREALHACWQAEGIFIRHDAITEGMLDRIFAEFCIGK